MVDARVVIYNENKHRSDLVDLMVKYATWLNNEVVTRYGFNLFSGDIEEGMKSFVSRVTSIEPPDGLILMLEVDDRPVGTFRLEKVEEGVGGFNQMWIDPEYRGRGYSKLLLKELEEKAKEFGYSKLILDTNEFNVVAQHLYKKSGFKETGKYPGKTYSKLSDLGVKIYMEKNL